MKFERLSRFLMGFGAFSHFEQFKITLKMLDEFLNER